MKSIHLLCAVQSAGRRDGGQSRRCQNPSRQRLRRAGLCRSRQADRTAPETFKAQFNTTKGKVVIEVTRSLSPNGADRFYNLVRSGYFKDIAFFRVIPGFMCQFGIHGDPAVSAKWRDANIADDPVKGSNTRGAITFATAGPNTRTTQLFINFGDNVGLDGRVSPPSAKWWRAWTWWIKSIANMAKARPAAAVRTRAAPDGRQRLFEEGFSQSRLYQIRRHRAGGGSESRHQELIFMSEVAILTTSAGEMVLEFWPDVAPGHVENFKKLARQGFYDGTCFHRVIKGFMIQGGDPNTKDETKEATWGTGGPGHKIKAEFNDRPHVRGVLSMARSNDPHSAGSQFFICHGDPRFLDRQYTAFGRLIKGDDVLEKIATTPTRPGDRPVARQALISVKIVPAAEAGVTS